MNSLLQQNSDQFLPHVDVGVFSMCSIGRVIFVVGDNKYEILLKYDD